MKILVPSAENKQNLLSVYIERWVKLDPHIEVTQTSENLIWVEEVGNILLWPWDQISHVIDGTRIDSTTINACAKVYFNELPKSDASPNSNYLPSFYWARNPILAELKSKHWRDWSKRSITSSFIGRYENDTQKTYRHALGYEDVIEDFTLLSPEEPYPYDSNQYYDRLLDTKFSLCPRGFGPKTHREIESFATGAVVLLHAESSDFSGYAEPLIPNTHFIPFNTVSQIKDIVDNTLDDEWRHISLNALAWYTRNCTFEGSLNVIKNVIQLKTHA